MGLGKKLRKKLGLKKKNNPTVKDESQPILPEQQSNNNNSEDVKPHSTARTGELAHHTSRPSSLAVTHPALHPALLANLSATLTNQPAEALQSVTDQNSRIVSLNSADLAQLCSSTNRGPAYRPSVTGKKYSDELQQSSASNFSHMPANMAQPELAVQRPLSTVSQTQQPALTQTLDVRPRPAVRPTPAVRQSLAAQTPVVAPPPRDENPIVEGIQRLLTDHLQQITNELQDVKSEVRQMKEQYGHVSNKVEDIRGDFSNKLEDMSRKLKHIHTSSTFTLNSIATSPMEEPNRSTFPRTMSVEAVHNMVSGSNARYSIQFTSESPESRMDRQISRSADNLLSARDLPETPEPPSPDFLHQ